MKLKGRIFILLLILVLPLFVVACINDEKQQGTEQGLATPSPITEAADPITEPETTQSPEPTQVSEPEALTPTKPAGFYVEGRSLFDVNGNEFIMRGINHAHTWYKGQWLIALEAIAATGSNTVRIVLSDGQQWEKDDAAYIQAIIDKCKELKMIVVLEVHDITGNNSAEALDRTVDYWISLKDVLMGNEQYVIINIANEWFGDWKSREWADGYIAAIPKLREAGYSHTILVDSAGWGQYAKSVHDFGSEILEADPIKNTMFAIHMYEYSGKDEATIKTNIDGVHKDNLCVTIGEFGFKHTSGDVDEGYILEYSEEIGVGYIGWSWKGNGGGVEYLDIAKEWDGSALSPDWGEILINSEFGIRNTSKICTVFE